MKVFTFEPLARPFPRWKGPFSPGRGKRTGFRFHDGRFGTWVEGNSKYSFWAAADTPGERAVSSLVRSEWGGGRVLLLPNGYVVKPLQGDDEVGSRALIGRFLGSMVLEKPDHSTFDFASPGRLRPGQQWPGPATTGLECEIRPDGALVCSWCHPTAWGRDEVSELIAGPDRTLATGFKAARPGEITGRVRVTANGHIITRRPGPDDSLKCFYVGYTDPTSWIGWDKWIRKERR